MSLESRLKSAIRDVPDFPKPGIVFKDISTVLLDPVLSNDLLDALVTQYAGIELDAIAGIESRGFLFGQALALRLGKPFVLIRKVGKLPARTHRLKYALEYGEAEIEMHADAIPPGARVLIHDDLLATGGSAEAAALLVQNAGGTVAGFSFLVELAFLNGNERLQPLAADIRSLVVY
jgi:adenine phosphoribosyltransferase